MSRRLDDTRQRSTNWLWVKTWSLVDPRLTSLRLTSLFIFCGQPRYPGFDQQTNDILHGSKIGNWVWAEAATDKYGWCSLSDLSGSIVHLLPSDIGEHGHPSWMRLADRCKVSASRAHIGGLAFLGIDREVFPALLGEL